MDQHRLSAADIVVGEPLPWDVYGDGNRLLLRRGHIVQSERQVDELVERGVYVDSADAERLLRARRNERDAASDGPQKLVLPSALHAIKQAGQRLERLLHDLEHASDAQAETAGIAKLLAAAVDINPDIALATILLNRVPASYAVRHGIDTALLVLVVAQAMKKVPEEVLSVACAALTMNVGMLRYQDQLQVKSGTLTKEETELLCSHPREGVALLSQAGIRDMRWLDCIRLHHESGDANGYPLGREAENIPQDAKLLALADHYCAAVSPRLYRRTLLPAVAMRDVIAGEGRTHDPMLAAYFIKSLGPYPPGSHVQLQNGEIGVVTRRTRTPAAPVVHALIAPRGAVLPFPVQRDTSKPLYAVRDAVPSSDLCFSMQKIWGDEAAP